MRASGVRLRAIGGISIIVALAIGDGVLIRLDAIVHLSPRRLSPAPPLSRGRDNLAIARIVAYIPVLPNPI